LPVTALARVNSSLLPVQIGLTEAGIPCTAPLDRRALDRTGVKTALAYLRMGLTLDSLRRDDVLQTIRRPSRKIARNVVEMATKRQVTSVEDLRRLADALTGGDAPKLIAYADNLEVVATACRQSTAAALRAVRVRIGLGDTMDILDSSREEADRSTHADDLVALEAVAALHPDPATFEGWLRDLLGRDVPTGPAVLLSTIHKIKGREWEHVIVYGASKGLLPHRLSRDEEGERRVFHVALTRAIRQVVVLADANDTSPFVSELDGTRPHRPLELSTGKLDSSITAPSSVRAGAHRESGRLKSSNFSRRQMSRPTVSAREVPATLGLMLEWGGHLGTVVDLTASAALLHVGTSKITIKFGTEVRILGTTVVLAAPGEDKAQGEKSIASEEQALREWRAAAAMRASVPAYVVLNDKELVGIAASKPLTLAELARCKGIGPTRLERWGDEILAVLSELTGDSG
jgi:hypothetical protein